MAADRIDTTQAAEDFLDVLYTRDPAHTERIEDALDDLVADPGAATWRRHRYDPDDGPPLWAFVVPGREEVAVLWRIEETDGDAVLYVPYIGPLP